MALHDWNHDGKKDMVDNYMEYQIYKETTGKKQVSGSGLGGGASTFGAIVAVIGGLFLAAAIMALLCDDGDVPVILTIILWVICASVISVWLDGR